MPSQAIRKELSSNCAVRSTIAELATTVGACVIVSSKASVSDSSLRRRKATMAEALPSSPSLTLLSDNPDPVPQAMVSRLISDGRSAVVIIDNRGSELRRKLAEKVKGSGSSISLITLEFDTNDDQPAGTEVFKLEPASTELISGEPFSRDCRTQSQRHRGFRSGKLPRRTRSSRDGPERRVIRQTQRHRPVRSPFLPKQGTKRRSDGCRRARRHTNNAAPRDRLLLTA